MTDVEPYWQNFIDGEFIDGGAGRLDILDPGTGEKLAERALADAADVDRAVHAAKRVSNSRAWMDLRPVERGRVVRKMGEYILERIDEIAPILTRCRQAALGSPAGDRGCSPLFRVLWQPGGNHGGPFDPAGRRLFRFHRP